MIKNYLLLLALCFFSSSKAQIITFPDANFKAKLLEADTNNEIAKDNTNKNIKIDLNGDGEIDRSEASKVSYLNVSGSNIASLTGIKSFTILYDFDCSSNTITDLDISNMSSLAAVNCSGNKIVTINHSGATSLRGFMCIDNLLTHLDLSDFLHLTELQCDGNKLTNLDNTPMPELRILGCSSNLLNSLDLSGLNPNVFESLSCQLNNISNLDLSRFTKLKSLNCDMNPLTSLKITAYESLQNLSYSETKLSNYDVAKFPNLLYLSCNKTETTTLDLVGLKKITKLYCSENFIENLDLKEALDLKILDCQYNKLTNLDLSKLAKLEELLVSADGISALNFDELVSLQRVEIWYTPIKSIDLSKSPSLKEFHIFQNPVLETLNIKNGSLENVITLTGNPKLVNICADDDQITTIENTLKEDGITDYNVNSYCTFTPGGESFSIQGTNRNDLNNNGCDAFDFPASFLKFKIEDGTESGNLISNGSGNYDIKVSAGNYKITPVFENPSYFSISPSEVQVQFPAVSSPMMQDFCIKAIGNHNDLEIAVIPIDAARPGFDAKYKLVYKNKGTTVQSGTLNLSFDDSILDFVSSNSVVSNQSSGKLVWNFSNLKPFESREIDLVLNVNSPVETPAVNNGDILKYKVIINSAETDETPDDNVFEFPQTVVGSYDPNDKTCLEGKVIKPELIGQYVHYLIRFENTGTYNAENVVIKDIIDTSKFDVSTLVPTSSSHSYITKISEGNKVEFIFEKINLPFDDANNDGYIAFKIKTLPTLVVGDTFQNEANIYFDYNFPILTNKETSTFKTLGRQDFELSSSFSVYPNPVQNYLQIDAKDLVEIESVYVYNVLGQLIQVIPNAQNISKIDVSKFKSGNYILQVKTATGNLSTKFIKI